MQLRIKALEIALTQAGKVFEQGGNNRGPKVEEYQAADDLPGGGYAWCASFVQWCFAQAGKPLENRTASVGLLLSWAKSKGYTVTRPLKGDLVCFHFDSDRWPDHIGFVEKVLKLGPVFTLRTVEGNTSASGAVSDPGTGKDGVYNKIRVVRASSVEFIRIPGEIKPKTALFDVYVNGALTVKGLKKQPLVQTRRRFV